jgi:hypothetical protein
MAKKATKPKGTGLAVHIGLNAVDPAHYEGWSGPLNACEADANDMAAISKAFKFKPTTLLTHRDPRKGIAAMRAAKAEEGDSSCSYSGPAGRSPTSRAKTTNRTRPGVSSTVSSSTTSCTRGWPLRLRCAGFVLSDSYSGTVTRDRPVPPPPSGSKMPPDVARKTYAAHKELRRIADGVSKLTAKLRIPTPCSRT